MLGASLPAVALQLGPVRRLYAHVHRLSLGLGVFALLTPATFYGCPGWSASRTLHFVALRPMPSPAKKSKRGIGKWC